MTTVAFRAGKLNQSAAFDKVLVVSPFTEGYGAVRRALDGSPWQICFARDFAETLYVLETERVMSVICDADLYARDWRELLRSITDFDDAPSFILASAHPDEYLWAEVLNLGGYDVLVKPFDANEIDRVLASARAEMIRHSGRESR